MTENETRTTLVNNCAVNVGSILDNCFDFDSTSTKCLVVYDLQTPLSEIIFQGYKIAIPNATFLNFDTTEKDDIISAFDSYPAGSLVVLIQSGSFLLSQFRIRLHLFGLGLQVIEHMHLLRNDPAVYDVYVNSLFYDKNWYPKMSETVSKKLQIPNVDFTIESQDNTVLTVTGGLEIPKLNIGDYSGMDNTGGTFPIGEVFTEAADLSQMNGEIYIYAFAGTDFRVEIFDPFKIIIKNGVVAGWSDNAPQQFIDLYEMVIAIEPATIREIGFGLNRAITKERFLQDVTAFERILGMHLSMGQKHGVYKKPGLSPKKTKYHIDLFPVVKCAKMGSINIFKNGIYLEN